MQYFQARLIFFTKDVAKELDATIVLKVIGDDCGSATWVIDTKHGEVTITLNGPGIFIWIWTRWEIHQMELWQRQWPIVHKYFGLIFYFISEPFLTFRSLKWPDSFSYFTDCTIRWWADFISELRMINNTGLTNFTSYMASHWPACLAAGRKIRKFWELLNLIVADPEEIEFRITVKDSTLFDLFLGKKIIEVEYVRVCLSLVYIDIMRFGRFKIMLIKLAKSILCVELFSLHFRAIWKWMGHAVQ